MDRTDWLLWIGVAVIFGGGDIITTSYALGQGIPEANPFPAWMIEQIGVIPALAILKFIGLAALWVLWAITPKENHPKAVPATLLVMGVVLLAWNLMVIA